MFTIILFDLKLGYLEIEVYYDAEGGVTDITVNEQPPNDKQTVLINANMRKIQSEAVYRAQYPD